MIELMILALGTAGGLSGLAALIAVLLGNDLQRAQKTFVTAQGSGVWQKIAERARDQAEAAEVKADEALRSLAECRRDTARLRARIDASIHSQEKSMLDIEKLKLETEDIKKAQNGGK